MPIYSIQGPDGRIYDIEGPAGASDQQLIAVLKQQIGSQQAAPAGAAPSSLQDLAVSLGLGATGATKALTDVFGADNAASQTLESASKSLSGMYTPARQQELARRQELIKQAEKSGSTLEELKAYAGAIGEAPLQSALQGVGSFAPYAVAGAAGAGAKLLPSTIKTIQTIMGAAQGAGAVKGSVYDAVYDRLIQEGKSEPVAREQALAAQSYTEGDLLQQGIGAGLGALGARMGIEGMLVPGAAAKQIPGLGRRVGTAILEEAPIEGLQGGQERLAANLALQKQGYDVPTMQGVLGQAAQEALTAGFAAGPIAAVRSPADAIAAKKREEQTAAVAEQQRLADEEAARVAEYRQTPEYLNEIQNRYTALQQQVRDLESLAKSKPASDDLAGKQAKAQAGRELGELKKSDEYAETVSEYLQAKKLIDEQEAVKQSEKAAAETMRQPGAQADLFGAPTITDMTTKVPKALPTPVEFVDAQNYLQRQIDAAQTAYSTAATPQEARRYTQQYTDLQTKLEQLNALRPEIEAEQASKPEYERQTFPEQTDVLSVDKQLDKLRTKLQKAQEEGDIEKGSRLLDQIDELNQQPSLFSEENRRPAMEAMENAKLAEEIAAGAEEARRTRQRVEQEAAVLQRFGERKGARSPAEQAAYDLRLEEARALMSKFDEGEQDWAALKQDPASVELQEDRDNKRKELADKVDALTEELSSAPEADVADAFGRRDKQAVQQELNATTNLLQDLDKRIAIGEKYRRQGAVADTEIMQAKDQRVEDLLDRLLPKAVYSPEKYFAQTTRNLAIKREAEAEAKKRDDAFIELAYIYQFAKDKFTNKERNLANKLRVEFVESGVKEVELRRQLAGGSPLEPEAVQELRNQLRMVILDMSRMGIKRNADNSYQYGEVKGFVAEERRKEGAVTPEEAQSLQAELQTLRKYKLETLEPRLAALQQETRYLLRMGDREEDLDFVNERMNSPEIQQLRNRIGSVDLRLNELRAAMEAYVTGEHLENVVVPKVVQGSDADLYERTLAKPGAAVAVLEEQADGIVNRYATTIPDVEPVRAIRRLPLEVAQEQADRLNDLETQLKNINDRVKRAGRPTKQDKVDALNQLKEERFFIQREIERARERIKRLGDSAPGAAMPAEEQQDLFGPLEAERAVLAEKDRRLNALYDEREELVAELNRRNQLGATPELQALVDKYAKETPRLKALDEAIEEMEKERETARGKTSERYNAFKLSQEVGVTLTPEEAAAQRALPGMAPSLFQQGAKPVESATLAAARTKYVETQTQIEGLRRALAKESDGGRYFREMAAKAKSEYDAHRAEVERTPTLLLTARDTAYYNNLPKLVTKYTNLAKMAEVNKQTGKTKAQLEAALNRAVALQDKAKADLDALEKRQRAYEQRQAVVEGRAPGELEAERLKAGAGYKTSTGAVRKAPRKAASWDLKKEPKAATEKPAAIAAAKTAVDKAESLIKAAKQVVSTAKFKVNAVQRAQEANKNVTGAQTMVDMLKRDATTTFSPEKNAAIVEELRRLNAFIAENGTTAQKKEDIEAKYIKEASMPGPGVARLSARLEMAAKQTEKMVRDLTANSELAYENYLAARKAIDDDTSGDYRVFSSLEHKMTKADNKYSSAMNALEKASLAHAVARRDLLGLQKAIGDNVRSMYDRSVEILANAAKELQAVMDENTVALQQQAQTQAKLDAAEEQLAKVRAEAQAERNRAKNEEAAAERAKLDAAAAEREAKQRAAEGAGLPGVRVTKETGPLVYAVEANARRMLGLAESELKKAIADKDPKAAAQARKNIKRYERELAQAYGAAQKVKRTVGEGAVEVETTTQPVVAGERLAPRRQGPVVKKGTVPPSQMLSGTEESRTPIGKGNRPKQAGVIRLRASDMSPEAANAVSLATLKSQVDAARAGTKRKATLEAKYATAIDGLTAEQVADRLAEGKRLLGSGPTLEIIAAREKYREAVAAEEAANKAKLDAKTPATKELAQDAFEEAAAESDRAEQRLLSLEAAYELEKKKGTASKPAKEAAEEAVEEELGPETRTSKAIDEGDYATQSVTAPQTPMTAEGQEAVNDGRILDALQDLADNASEQFLRNAAAKLKPLLSRTKLRVVPDVTVNGEAVPAAYNAQENAILIRPGYITESNVIHEAVHAATMRVLEGADSSLTAEQLAAKKELTAMYKRLVADGTLSGEYAAKNVKEFASEVQSNAGLRSKMDKKPWFGANMLRRAINAILHLVGVRRAQTQTAAAQDLIERMYMQSGKIAAAPTAPSIFRNTAPVESAFIGSEPGKWKTFKENFFGIGGRVQLVDRLAAVDAGIVAAEGAGKLSSTEAFQAQYFMRLADQTTQAAGQFITSGPVSIVSEKRLNGTEYRYQSQQGANLVNMSELMEGAAKAGDMSPQEAERMLTSIVAGERASATPNGWSRLFADNPAAARAEYDKDVAFLKASPEAKRYMDAAKAEYKKYNEGLVDFLAQTGRITKQEADRLKKTPYIPFYRIENGVVKMFTDKEHSIRIGNIKDQPQLERMVGDNKHILPILTSAVQNTFMIANMGMQNKATMETSNAMYKAGFVSRIGEGTGPAGPDVVHYFVNGKPYFAVIDSDTFGIPAHLVVKGMEGIKTTIPALVQALGLPADIVRKFVTRTPAYVIRQLIRDPVNAYITSGVDGAPVINALKQMAKMRAGRSPAEEALMKGLAISSNIYSGNEKDMQKFLQDISSGKGKWDKMLGWLDTLALQADSATRANIYEDSINKGMSEAQAQFRALESQNFSRRGLSPSMQMLSTMVPFFNAQVQGLDVLYRSLSGKAPFSQQLEIRRKIMARGAMLMVGTLAYAMAMKDDDAYKKATPEERYANFFVRLPGVKDPLKIPIPFEIGILFKSLPEAVVDAMQNDTTAKEAAKGLGTVMLQSAPGVIPVGPKPIMEGLYGRTLQGDIESAHEKTLMATERYRETTPEALKRLGSITGEVGVSPIMLEHLTRGYTGTLGVSALHMLDPLLAEQANKASQPMSKTPFIGGLFQAEEGRFLINRAYERMDDIVKAKTTYEDMVRRGDRAAAESFAQRYASLLAMSDAAGSFRQRMGEMFADERAIRSDPRMSTAEKDALLKRIKDAENMEATAFYAAGERTKRQ